MNKLLNAELGRDGILMLSRLLLTLLFLIFGLEKLTTFHKTVTLFTQMAVPFPSLATIIAVAMEVGVGILLLMGLFTRPLAVLMAAYTFATALLGHHYWSLTGAERVPAEIDFYKNVNIVGGLFLLYLTGAGRYSLDQKLKL